MTYDLKALRDLEKRLEEATGPDSYIDCVLYTELGCASRGDPGYPNGPTASLDAAVALVERVLPHWGIKLDLWRDRDNEWNWWVKLTSPTEPDYEGDDPETFIAGKPHPRAALALCLACVRALIAQEVAA